MRLFLKDKGTLIDAAAVQVYEGGFCNPNPSIDVTATDGEEYYYSLDGATKEEADKVLEAIVKLADEAGDGIAEIDVMELLEQVRAG